MEKSIDADLLEEAKMALIDEATRAIAFMHKIRASRKKQTRAYPARHPEIISAINKRAYEKRKLEKPERQKELNRLYAEKRRTAAMKKLLDQCRSV